jgi:hypothetical protein
MGRAASAAPAPVERIALEPADYWQLMKLEQDIQIVTLQAKQQLAAVHQARTAFAHGLHTKYPAFQPADAHYRADDATCSLVRER